jgi:hypothetical protein
MDPSASPEDRAQRRRRLVKGPSESYRPTKDKSEMIEWFDDLKLGMRFKSGEVSVSKEDIKRFAPSSIRNPSILI